MIFNLFPLILIALSKCEAHEIYDNYKVYKVSPETEGEVKVLNDLRKDPHYDFWTDKVNIGQDVRIMVPPSKDSEFIEYLRSVLIEPTLSITNVQELIHSQLRPAETSRSSSLGSFNWNQYHNLDEIYAWLDELSELYPDIVTTITIGKSNEGRDIKGVVIDFKPENRGSAPLLGMLEGGIHAREWISPATVTWVIKEFLTSNNEDTRRMAENFVWHIFPVVNPDGYEFTFSENRMWRKNRNLVYNTSCFFGAERSHGVDLNRNFDYMWRTVGAASNPCFDTFAGPHAASEPETQAISNHVLRLKQIGHLVYYFAFHSYSQMTLVPFSHVSGADVLSAPNYGDLFEIAIRGAEKLTEKHGTVYRVGTSADILYAVSGSSFDWVKGFAQVPIVYLFELRDVGEYGFLLPPEQIIPNNEEIMACLVEMDKATRSLGYYSSDSNKIYVSSVLVISAIFLTLFKYNC